MASESCFFMCQLSEAFWGQVKPQISHMPQGGDKDMVKFGTGKILGKSQSKKCIGLHFTSFEMHQFVLKTL